MTDHTPSTWFPRTQPDLGHDQCSCHCYHCRPAHTAGLKCGGCGFMPATEPVQLLTDATVLLATALLAGATRKDLDDVLDETIWFAETGATPAPPQVASRPTAATSPPPTPTPTPRKRPPTTSTSYTIDSANIRP